MQKEETLFLKWQSRFGTEEACVRYLFEERWGNGFICAKCGHDQAYFVAVRKTQQCRFCRHQTSVTAGTLFHSTNLPLRKWFCAIFWVVSDKGGISAVRLSKYLDVSWLTARSMLRKIRTAMGNRDGLYRLTRLVEVDDTLLGGKRSGKRGRGAEGKTPTHLQEYLNEFCYRFNRRQWESQLPNRLLSLCVQHTPVLKQAVNC